MITTARLWRFGAAVAVVAGFVALPSLTASAHVTASSTDASPGGFGKVVFRVPSESDMANTTKITVALPADAPFAFVSTQAVPGWTVETSTETLPEPVEFGGFTVTEAVSSVTWAANSDETALHPHQFSEFAISAGPFPSDIDQLVFPTTQTYADGEIVEWSDLVVAGQDEPQRPAPVLALASPGAATAEVGSVAAVTETSDSDALARVLGGVGLALGVIAIGWVAVTRRSASVAS